MNKQNKIIFWTTILILIFSFGIPITYKIIKNHQEKLLIVSEKRIIEAAKKCINDSKCKQIEKITLQKLYDNNYLNEEANPLSKEIYNHNSYIIFEENKWKFITIN